MRFDPFRELDRLSQGGWPSVANRASAMPMDAYRHGDRFIVQFDLPGVSADSVELTVERNVLTVTAHREFERREGDDWVVAERPQGSFSRQLFLGETLDSDNVEANYDQGVLTLTIPVAEKAKARKVQIKANGTGAQAIDTGSSDTTKAQAKPSA